MKKTDKLKTEESLKDKYKDKDIKHQQAILEKIKFEVGQEMGIYPKEKNKNS